MNKLWFKNKKYGYGWTPVTWQGWLVIAIYVASILFFANLAKNYTATSDIVIGFVIPTGIFTILLIMTCRIKGEKPKWQWGNKQ